MGNHPESPSHTGNRNFHLMFHIARLIGIAPFSVQVEKSKIILRPSKFWLNYSLIISGIVVVETLSSCLATALIPYDYILSKMIVIVRLTATWMCQVTCLKTRTVLLKGLVCLYSLRPNPSAMTSLWLISSTSVYIAGAAYGINTQTGFWVELSHNPWCLYSFGVCLSYGVLAGTAVFLVYVVTCLNSKLRDLNNKLVVTNYSRDSVNYGDDFGKFKQLYLDILHASKCFEEAFSFRVLLFMLDAFVEITIYLYIALTGYGEAVVFSSIASFIRLCTMAFLFMTCGTFAKRVS